MAAAGLATKKATIEEALCRLLRRRERLDVLVDMAGLGWESDLAAMGGGGVEPLRYPAAIAAEFALHLVHGRHLQRCLHLIARSTRSQLEQRKT